MPRRHFYYPVPERPATLMVEITKHLPAEDWEVLDAVMVAVADDKAAIYLRAYFAERPVARNGTDLLDAHEVWIEPHEREDAERLLREHCPSPVAWFDIIEVGFEDMDAQRAFVRAYTGLTGIPHAGAGGVDPGAFDTLALARKGEPGIGPIPPNCSTSRAGKPSPRLG